MNSMAPTTHPDSLAAAKGARAASLRPRLRLQSAIRWLSFLAAVGGIAYSLDYLNIDLERLLGFGPRVIEVLSTRYYPPDLGYVAQPDFLRSVVQTLQMSLLGGAAGMAIALPLAWLGSYNLSPLPGLGAWIGRLSIMSARAIHETIWTILFVMILGFGMLPGILALTMFCIGFAGKLLSDEIEAIDMGPIEALKAAGAGPLQIFQHAALPQLRVAVAGIGVYTWDVAFRAATVVGFFGGGGMGLYLKQTVQQLDTHRTAAILLVIICLVTIAEIGSTLLRRAVRRM